MIVRSPWDNEKNSLPQVRFPFNTNKSDPTIYQGYSRRKVGIRGSLLRDTSLTHSRQIGTASVTVSFRREEGTTMRLLYSSRLSCSERELLTFQYGITYNSIVCFAGQPSLQYSVTREHSRSCSWASRYSWSLGSKARRAEVTPAMYISTSFSNSLELLSLLEQGARECVSCV